MRLVLLDYALLDGEAQEFGIVGEAEVLHDAVFVKGDGAGGDVGDGGGFFHGVAFRRVAYPILWKLGLTISTERRHHFFQVIETC